jgi:hypothetical protein
VDKPYVLNIDMQHYATTVGTENSHYCPTVAQPDVRSSDAVLRDTPCLEGGDDEFKSRAEIYIIWAFVANEPRRFCRYGFPELEDPLEVSSRSVGKISKAAHRDGMYRVRRSLQIQRMAGSGQAPWPLAELS